jgi:PEP-CTERM motif
MKKQAFVAMIAALAIGQSAFAADAFLFADSAFNSTQNHLDITTSTGSFVVGTANSGWFQSSGASNGGMHRGGGGNYFAGTVGGVNYNDFFVFDLSNVTGTVESASLSLLTVRMAGTLWDPAAPSVHFSLTGISDSVAGELTTTFSSGSPVGLSVYNALGSGDTLGARTYTPLDAFSVQSITFNATGLAALSSHEGRSFSVGGTVTAVPEPETYAMFLAGLGILGFVSRRRFKA